MKCNMWILAAVASTALSAGLARAATVDVTPANMNGWSFQSFDNNFNPVSSGQYAGTAQMVTGPAGQPLGTGSAHLATTVGNGDGGEVLATDNFDGTSLDALKSLSYSTYMTTNNGSQFPYIGLAISTDGKAIASDDSNLDFIDFEPPYQTPTTGNAGLPDQGPTVLDQWQSWNAFEGGWDAPNAGTGVSSLASYISSHPNATIADMTGGIFPGFGGINLQVGFASTGETFDGNVDAFSLGTAGGTTTYNFDPNAVPTPLPRSAGAGFSLLAGFGVIAALKKRFRPAREIV